MPLPPAKMMPFMLLLDFDCSLLLVYNTIFSPAERWPKATMYRRQDQILLPMLVMPLWGAWVLSLRISLFPLIDLMRKSALHVYQLSTQHLAIQTKSYPKSRRLEERDAFSKRGAERHRSGHPVRQKHNSRHKVICFSEYEDPQSPYPCAHKQQCRLTLIHNY